MSTFGERLKVARAGFTQGQAAAKIGIKQQQWARYEKGVTMPGSDILLHICTAFAMSSDWLLGLSDKAPASTTISAGGDVVVGNGSRITKTTVHAAPPSAPCAKCPYKALVSRLRKAGMTFPEFAQ